MQVVRSDGITDDKDPVAEVLAVDRGRDDADWGEGLVGWLEEEGEGRRTLRLVSYEDDVLEAFCLEVFVQISLVEAEDQGRGQHSKRRSKRRRSVP